jgi:hypothetical protein
MLTGDAVEDMGNPTPIRGVRRGRDGQGHGLYNGEWIALEVKASGPRASTMTVTMMKTSMMMKATTKMTQRRRRRRRYDDDDDGDDDGDIDDDDTKAGRDLGPSPINNEPKYKTAKRFAAAGVRPRASARAART